MSKQPNIPQQHRIPQPLKAKELREAINVGLHYLCLGYRPKEEIEEGSRVNQRIPINEKGWENLEWLLKEKAGEWETPADVVTAALQWLKEQPKHVLSTRIE